MSLRKIGKGIYALYVHDDDGTIRLLGVFALDEVYQLTGYLNGVAEGDERS